MRKSRCYGCLTCSLLGFYGNEAAVICDHTMVSMTSMSLGYHSSSSHRNLRSNAKIYHLFQDEISSKLLICIYLLHFDRGCVCLCSAIQGWDASKTARAFTDQNYRETNMSCRQEPLSFKQRDIEDKDINKASSLLGILQL